MIKFYHWCCSYRSVSWAKRRLENEEWIWKNNWEIYHTASFAYQNLWDFSKETSKNVHRGKMKKICTSLFRNVCSFWYECLNYFGIHRNHCFPNKAKENLIGFPHGEKLRGISPSEEIVKINLPLRGSSMLGQYMVCSSHHRVSNSSSWDQHNLINWISPPSGIEPEIKIPN